MGNKEGLNMDFGFLNFLYVALRVGAIIAVIYFLYLMRKIAYK